MSFELFKSITQTKDGKIFVTTASNNVWPKTYQKYEVFSGIESAEDKKLLLFYNLLNGNLQASTINDNTLKYVYALLRIEKDIKADGLDEYEDMYCKSSSSDIESVRAAYGKYHAKFEQYLNEKDRKVKVGYGPFYKVCGIGKYDWRKRTFNNIQYSTAGALFSYKKAYILANTFSGKENFAILEEAKAA